MPEPRWRWGYVTPPYGAYVGIVVYTPADGIVCGKLFATSEEAEGWIAAANERANTWPSP